MQVPDTFRKAISDIFYDKTVQVLSKEIVTDTEGSRRSVPGVITGTFKGNVNFNTLAAVQESYGLDYEIDITITTAYDGIKVNDLISYDGRYFEVTDCKPFDTHYQIVGIDYGR